MRDAAKHPFQNCVQKSWQRSLAFKEIHLQKKLKFLGKKLKFFADSKTPLEPGDIPDKVTNRSDYRKSRRAIKKGISVATRVARWFLFRPKIPNLGTLWRTLERKVLLYILAIWNSLRPMGIFHGHLAAL
jgi:hypothetical protein